MSNVAEAAIEFVTPGGVVSKDIRPGGVRRGARVIGSLDVHLCMRQPAVPVAFQGLAPGELGVEQINSVVPASQQPGNWTLFFDNGTSADGASCNAGAVASASVLLPVD